jgi:hypothetical protein
MRSVGRALAPSQQRLESAALLQRSSQMSSSSWGAQPADRTAPPALNEASMPRVGSCRFVPGAFLRVCGSCRFVSKFLCVSHGSCHACRKFVCVSCVSGSVCLTVFLCVSACRVSRVMRVAYHACQTFCMSCVSHAMRVWLSCGSVCVRVRFLRVCGSFFFLRVLWGLIKAR